MDNLFIYDTKIGKIAIEDNGKSITKLYLANSLNNNYLKALKDRICETKIIKIAEIQLDEYFDGKRTCFDLPLEPKGTDFQKMVWNELCNIQYGKTESYKGIAEKIGVPKAFRAVGMANNKNPIMIIIPCHRVIGSKGNLVGYAGGIEIKKKLLNIEKRKI